MSHVVLDIEGTCSPLSAVRDQLFGYARAHYLTWVSESQDDAIALARAEAASQGQAAGTDAELAAVLTAWTDDDVKSPALKRIQGRIWQGGFASGELVAPVYDDVVRALRRWHDDGVPVHVYSSGSAQAQRDWFAHTDHGDLSEYLAGHFDLVTAGPKKDPASYATIAAELAVDASELLFLTDDPAELDAAQQAGWRAHGMHRPGNPPIVEAPGRVWSASFDELFASGVRGPAGSTGSGTGRPPSPPRP